MLDETKYYKDYQKRRDSGELKYQAQCYNRDCPHLIGYHDFLKLAFDHCQRHGWHVRVMHMGDFIWDVFWVCTHPTGVLVAGCLLHFWMAYETGETLDEIFLLDKT